MYLHKMLPVHQAIALDALVGQGIASDFAGIAAVALDRINAAAVCADNDTDMVGFSVKFQSKKMASPGAILA